MGLLRMNTSTDPAVIPEHLTQWQPPCGMFEGYEPSCDRPAEHALITHGGCSVRLTCGPCYRKFMTVFADWLAERPESNIVVCQGCRTPIGNPWVALHLEPL